MPAWNTVSSSDFIFGGDVFNDAIHTLCADHTAQGGATDSQCSYINLCTYVNNRARLKLFKHCNGF